MGNSAITRKIDASKEFSATAGHNQLWHIYHGKTKQTGQEVSVWVFDKSYLTKKNSAPIDKAVQEQILQIMRKDFNAMKDSSSENVISVLEVLEESTMLAFTTERVLFSMADVLNRFDGIVDGRAQASEFLDENCTLCDLEIGKGFLNIAEGLQFIHTIKRKLHGNLNPESIIITKSGKWKLCGLGFGLSFTGGETSTIPSPYFLKVLNHTLRLEPDLAYASPEMTLGGSNPSSIREISYASDIFSLALLMYDIYKFNHNARQGKLFMPTLCIPSNNADRHVEALNSLYTLDYTILPNQNIVQLLSSALQLNPRVRPSLSQILTDPFFAMGSLAILKSVEVLHTRDMGTQSSVLVNLPSQLEDFPVRMLENFILPSICKLTETNNTLWTYALPVHEYLASRLSSASYKAIASACIAEGLSSNANVEVMKAFLNKYEFIRKAFDNKFFSVYFISALLCNGLDNIQTAVKVLCFQVLFEDDVHGTIEINDLKDKVIPKACREACKNADTRIKIHALYFLSLVCDRLDRTYLAKNILPSLKYITDNEKDPIVSMCVVGNYDAIAENVGPDYIASSILPSIQPMLVDKSLTREQFELVVNVMKNMLSRVLELRSVEMGISPPLNLAVPVTKDKKCFDAFSAARKMVLPPSTRKKSLDTTRSDESPLSTPQYDMGKSKTSKSNTSTITPSSLKIEHNPNPVNFSNQSLPDRPPPPVPSKPPPSSFPTWSDEPPYTQQSIKLSSSTSSHTPSQPLASSTNSSYNPPNLTSSGSSYPYKPPNYSENSLPTLDMGDNSSSSTTVSSAKRGLVKVGGSKSKSNTATTSSSVRDLDAFGDLNSFSSMTVSQLPSTNASSASWGQNLTSNPTISSMSNGMPGFQNSNFNSSQFNTGIGMPMPGFQPQMTSNVMPGFQQLYGNNATYSQTVPMANAGFQQSNLYSPMAQNNMNYSPNVNMNYNPSYNSNPNLSFQSPMNSNPAMKSNSNPNDPFDFLN